MGYAFYTLADGREAGYGVEALCDFPGCRNEIDRGLGYLCGEFPAVHGPSEYAECQNYFCGTHESQKDHNCPYPRCGEWPSEAYELLGVNDPCVLLEAHDLPHENREGEEFDETETDDQEDSLNV